MAKLVNQLVDLEEMDIDDMEQELTQKVAEDKAKKEKAPKAPKEPKEPKAPKIGANQIGAAGIAEMVGTTPRELRMFLRKHFRDMNKEKGQTYVWDKDSPEVQTIIDAYKAAKAAPRPKRVKAVEEAADEIPTANVVDLDDIDFDEE